VLVRREALLSIQHHLFSIAQSWSRALTKTQGTSAGCDHIPGQLKEDACGIIILILIITPQVKRLHGILHYFINAVEVWMCLYALPLRNVLTGIANCAYQRPGKEILSVETTRMGFNA
jgi:hypothetical protein